MTGRNRFVWVVAWLALLPLPGKGESPASQAVLAPLPGPERSLAERFAQPPAAARILKIIHQQPPDPAAQDRLLRSLAEQGFGGFVGNVSFDGYLEDETKWPAFLRGVREAKKAGMSLWLYDERGYPSGSAGDLTLRGHPEWAARGLLVAEAATEGGEVTLDLPPGKLIRAVALPVRQGRMDLRQAQDLAGAVSGGKLRWRAPPGGWRVFAMTEDLIFENTHAGISLAMKFPCINLLMPEPTARFLEVTHDRYAARLGDDLGQWFVSTFTDEPSLQNYWFKPMPYLVLPWSANLAEEFQKRRGTELLPLLPALAGEAGPEGAKARYDFWLTIGELVSGNYFGQIQDWCHRHHVRSGGHLLIEESLTAHVPFYGDFFRCARRLDAPGIDCLTSVPGEVPWRIARLMGSVADLERRTVTMCETSDHSQRYRRPGDERPVRLVTEAEIRGTCNRILFGGMHTITSYYSFAGLDGDALRRLNLHVGRCSTLLSGGHQVADVAVLYPIESVWPEYVPALQGATGAPAARQIEQVYRSVSDTLYGANRDFRYVDGRALMEAKPADGAMVHGDLRWRVVVLPATSTLPLAAWENLARFWRGGGVVIAVGARPANSESEFPSARVRELAKELFGESEPGLAANPAGGAGVYLPAGMIGLLPVVLDRLIEADVQVDGGQAPVRVTHRRVEGHDVYLAINDSAQDWQGTLRLSGRGTGEQWDPGTGEAKPCPGARDLPLRMGPYGAQLWRFDAATEPGRRQGGQEPLPDFRREPLPVTPPRLGHGQFVQGLVSGNAGTGWRAVGKLTKGQVDTHLFLSFSIAPEASLAEAQGLMLDTSVPEGQRTNSQLLVILREKGGADYIAGTGRTLSGPVAARFHVLFTDFDLAGWSKDGNDKLDVAEVAALSVGWGGYFGVEGETVEFQVQAPRRLVLR